MGQVEGDRGKVTRSGSRSKEECVVSLACCVVVGCAKGSSGANDEACLEGREETTAELWVSQHGWVGQKRERDGWGLRQAYSLC